MRKTFLPRLVKLMLVSGLAYLALMTILRWIFFFHFRPASYSVSDCFQAIWLGLHFDTRIVSGIVLFPFLVGNLRLRYGPSKRLTAGSIFGLILTVLIMVLLLLFMKKGHVQFGPLVAMGVLFAMILVWLIVQKNCNPFENSFSRKVFRIYFLIVNFSLAFLYTVDFEYFDYLHQRLNASILNFSSDATASAEMVWQTYPVFVLILLIILVALALSWLHNYVVNKIKNAAQHSRGFSQSAIGIAFALILGLGIFGKLNQYPLRWSDAFAFNDDFKANLALNPVQSFFSTLEFRNSTFDIRKVRAGYPLVAQFLGVDHPDSTSLNFDRSYAPATHGNPVNVVVVICESFSAYKSSMWGNPLNTTPYFDSMCKKGIFFDRCFTPAWGTARGVWAVVTGIPDVEYPNTSSRNPAYVNQHSIINDYPGYDKYYFIGGSSSWANIRGVLTNNIGGLHIYEQGSYKAHAVDVWGISDKRLFLAANKVLKKETHPFFAVIQTADNHRPYTIPGEDKGVFHQVKLPQDTLVKYGFQSNEELNAFRYTDFSFETFMKAAKKEAYFKNTIFVFVGDHGIRGQVGNMFPKAWEEDGLTTQHVPLLFYAPDLLSPMRSSRTCSQVDILPSVTALAHIPYTNTTIGRNLFDTTRVQNGRFRDAAFLYDPNLKQIGIVTDQYAYVHNLLSGTEDFRSSVNNDSLPASPEVAQDHSIIKNLAQGIYETSRYLLSHNLKKNVVEVNTK